jgi:hypothetical protein
VLEDVDFGPLGAEDVEVAVDHCSQCHSDLPVLNNAWGLSTYPGILGHEVTGRVAATGPDAKGLAVGQRVGIGWNSGSAMHSPQCMSGNHHLCPQVQPTTIGHRGGFAIHGREVCRALIPPPPTHRHCYHGVLAAHSRLPPPMGAMPATLASRHPRRYRHPPPMSTCFASPRAICGRCCSRNPEHDVEEF